MSNRKLVLGIDTSNYTTSMALVDVTEQRLIKEVRRVLPVKEGTVGLRQSDALFHHVKNLPDLSKALLATVDPNEIVAISGTTRPRPLEESYMPVFLASESYGKTLSNTLKVPFYELSHQEGHIEAGLWSINREMRDGFLALHLSGGTTEALEISPTREGYDIKIVGETGDISAGQFIDRIGVKLGLPFPAGPHLEALAQNYKGEAINVSSSVKGTTISFSGPETYLQKFVEKGSQDDKVAYSLFQCVGITLVGLIKGLIKKYPYKTILLVGGVASNQLIKEKLEIELGKYQLNLLFANPKYCSDNAVGIALLGIKKYIGEEI
ncbi:tRNA (adenosine(37)-N6)-threonylcarbamoyltransferase complex transferase subunit TsaD [Alkaliphilus transvaalensis]|uniref:O-sialoglycoprotein endopeptidase n=1 Tax=Alkaliphilus transvaalensis TaxID=114628 RepID=UPI00047B0081|nr:O-sialoglycoprotein endopeptidase [Alkaliphilus transvaalensis]